MKLIPLSQGKYVKLDDEDYDRVVFLHWHAANMHGFWYAMHSLNGRSKILMHRFLLNAKPGEEIDHMNGDGLDNRRSNLRFCTRSQNQMNGKKRYRTKTSSRFKGVYWHKQTRKWHVQIQIQRFGRTESLYLGTFENEFEAAEAYDRAARIFFGNFARLNFPHKTESPLHDFMGGITP